MSYSIPEDFDYQIAAEPEAAGILNRELNLAHTVVEQTGANLFLTGKAGTGKTTFLRRLAETSKKRLVVLAPTGVAAINARGTTIHSLFQFPFTPFAPGHGFFTKEKPFFRFSKYKIRLLKSLDLLVIDEISMVRPDLLDAIDDALRRIREDERPFGGVQLLLIGDLRQLAPVVRDDEWSMISQYYPSPYFFESHALRRAGFITIELLTIYRQNDRRFVEILNAVRDGVADTQTLAELNSRCIPNFNPPESEGYIRLVTHNRQAAFINESRLNALPGESVDYKASTEGNFPESSYPADAVLSLKPGARVMFIKNDTGEGRAFFNGMLGTVVDLRPNVVTVRPLDGSPDIEVGVAEWENTRYEVDPQTPQIRQIVDGVFRQFPLRTAWAITIHKSQGLTFDRAIIDATRSFAPGQAYVALSRCRTLEGLVLDANLPASAIIVDNVVNAFIDDARAKRPDAAKVESLKAEFSRSLLADIFDFTAVEADFQYLKRIATQYVAPLYPELFGKYEEVEKSIATQAVAVGRRFAQLYASGPVDADNMPEETVQKIKNGCAYFLDIIAKVADLVNHTPLQLDNAGYQKALLGAIERIEASLQVKKCVLEEMQTQDFSPSAYLDAKARAMLRAETSLAAATPKTSKRVRPTAEKKPKKPKGYSMFESLNLYMSGKSIPEIAAERNLVESTICHHLAQAVAGGHLSMRDLITEAEETALDQLFTQHPDTPYNELLGQVPAGVSFQSFRVYYYYRRRVLQA